MTAFSMTEEYKEMKCCGANQVAISFTNIMRKKLRLTVF
jgi:hypothetical protein